LTLGISLFRYFRLDVGFLVYRNAEIICKKEESADSDIVLSAALLRDLIFYPKRSSKTLNSADDSAEIAQKILSQYHSYPTEKIEK